MFNADRWFVTCGSLLKIYQLLLMNESFVKLCDLNVYNNI